MFPSSGDGASYNGSENLRKSKSNPPRQKYFQDENSSVYESENIDLKRHRSNAPQYVNNSDGLGPIRVRKKKNKFV